LKSIETMETYFIALPIPPLIKKQIGRLCYGLASNVWEEEDNFYIILKPLGLLVGNLYLDVKEKLAEFVYQPFPLILSGLEISESLGRKRVLHLGIKPKDSLLKLQNLIDNALKELDLAPAKKIIPSLILAHFEKVSPRRLSDYLEANAYFSTESFMIDKFAIISRQTTPKRTISIQKEVFKLKKSENPEPRTQNPE
jgi:2'-5' RNA ligase